MLSGLSVDAPDIIRTKEPDQMPRVATGDTAELERELGPRGSLRVTSENRNTVRRWLRARGLPGVLVQGLSVSILEKTYNDEASFNQMNQVIEDTMAVPIFSPDQQP